jgi:hypothetical protein
VVQSSSPEQNCALYWVPAVGGEVGDQQPALPPGKPRLDRLPLKYDSEPPAQLNPYHAPATFVSMF